MADAEILEVLNGKAARVGGTDFWVEGLIVERDLLPKLSKGISVSVETAEHEPKIKSNIG